MVQDARVSRQMARLGGVYRDPARVNRDASSLLKSSVGTHLQPIAAVFADDSGSTHTVLVLQGTIAIHFRGNTYQLLMDVYLVPGYPTRPPVCYVRLAPNMYLKENHKHVGSDGKVYLPYLHEWRSATHNLVELVVAMSSVFSADPPVFSRPSTSTTTTTTTAARPPATAAASRPHNDPPPFSQALNTSTTSAASAASTTTASSSNWRTQQDELEAALAASAAEAQAAADQARRQEQEALERAQRESAAAAYEQAQKRQLRDSLQAKLQAHFRQQALRTKQLVREDAADQQALGGPEAVQAKLKFYRDQKSNLQRRCAAADEAVRDIQEWLREAEADRQNSKDGAPTKKKSIDEICVPATPLAAQQLELAAENAALQDALYFLDRALYQEKLDATQHLRTCRTLAKRQFLVRAHLLKILKHQQ